MTHYIAEIESRVCGIPCIIGVVGYDAYVPAYTGGLPENCYPSEGGDGEYDILDRRGRLAPWLQNKMTGKDEDRVRAEIYEYMENNRDDY